jgi:glycosyltransferase involved in cell wall biosynthesis
MKIAVIGPTYPYKGGVSHFTTILVNQLRKTDEVFFISWKVQYPKFLYPVDQKDTQSKKAIKTKVFYLLNFYNPLSWVTAALRIRRSKSDKLVLTWVTPVQAPIYIVISAILKLSSKTKLIYLCHNSLPHEVKFYDKPLTKLTFKFADEFIAHSKEDKNTIEQLSNNKPVTLAFHPIYEEFNTGKKWNSSITKNELGLKNNVLLFFGYIRPYKGLKYLIHAMPEILKNNPETTLLVVGEFWSKDKPVYEKLVQELMLKNNVVFIDQYVPNEEVGKFFSAADVVVCPYVSSTQSGIIQMAYAFDKPVIATRVGGIPDVVIPGKSGLLIAPKNAKQITKAIDQFYAKPIDPKNLDAVRNNLSWSKYVKIAVGSKA